MGESDDDFDTRFGHLIGLNVNHDNEDDHYDEEEDDDEAATAAADTDHDDLNESIDEDLVEILDKTPNWEPNTSLKKFITKTCDHALPEEILKKINDDYVPQKDL